jgi:hypothetical protein
MACRHGLLLGLLCALLPLNVSGGLHFTAWLADIVAEKGVNQFETDYRWTEISGGGGMSLFLVFLLLSFWSIT